MASSDVHTAVGYGNWKKPTPNGMFGLGQGATKVLGVCLILLFVVAQTAGMIPALVLGGIGFVVLMSVTQRDADGLNQITKVSVRLGWKKAQRRGSNLYRSGPLGRTPWGTCQLPGIAAGVSLHEYRDSYGRPFAVLDVRAAGSVVVVLGSEPEGNSLVDPDQVDRWVAQWGGWLAGLNHLASIQAAAVTIETSPDPGTRLHQEIDAHLDPHAPQLALDIMGALRADSPLGSSRTRSFVTLTFSRTGLGGRKRTVDDIAADLANRLPALTGQLEFTGAGAVSPVSAQELCEVIRTAYDPVVGPLIEQATTAGQELDLQWADVGPAAHEATWGEYRHDSGRSVTWMMTEAPRGVVQSSVLDELLAPHREIPRKRVTILYRPYAPAVATKIVDADVNAASAQVSPRPTATQRRAIRSAEKSAEEEASGASLLAFGALFTATVLDPETTDAAEAVMSNLGPAARLRLRRAYGSQDVAFAAALPLGLHLPKFATSPLPMADQR